MLKKIKKELLKQDIFAHQPTVGWKKKKKYYTYPGAVYTLLLKVVYAYLFYGYIEKMLSYRDPYTNTS